jgi:hypothetical protein
MQASWLIVDYKSTDYKCHFNKLHLYPIDPLPASGYLSLMPNIKFNYRYRDGANYKNHSFVVLNNPTDIALANIENSIREKLIDDIWFYADKWNLPDLHFGTWDNEADHTWHEFESIELTDETGDMDISNFISAIKD